jgi:hypothetical protein
MAGCHRARPADAGDRHPRDNRAMSPLLEAAFADVAPLQELRGWPQPTPATVEAAERLLVLVRDCGRPPTVQVEADGRISLEWEAAGHGWLTLLVDGSGRLKHRAVIDEDEFEQSEPFGRELPGWASTLLGRILRIGH